MRRMWRSRRHTRRDKTLAREVPPILQEANFAFDKGEYGRAGELFERIAEAAAMRNGPRAPTFFLQAGRARILAGQTGLGLPSLKRGLDLLAQRQHFTRLQNAGARVILELNERGLTGEAAEIETWLRGVLPSAVATESPVKRPVLPTHCPACGAPARPDEVEWPDDVTAECAYCGSPIR